MFAKAQPVLVMSALMAMLLSATAPAQTSAVESSNASKGAGSAWPARSIRLVVPFPPGGATDANARVLAKEMEVFLGQPVVVDNRGGANGIIGSDIVAKAAPDGYTMMHISVAFAINPSTYKKLPFDSIRDFTPITNPIVGNGALLVVHPSLPARSVTELIAVAKKQQLVFSSPGIGNVLHLINEAFNVRAGIRMLHVPYKGSGPALVAVLGGEAQVNVVPPLTATTHVRAERLRALGYSGIKRLETLPDLPTIAEAGLPGFHIDTGWHGWFAPAKTPARIVNQVYGAIHKSLQTARMRDVFKAAGYEPVADPPAVFQKTVVTDIQRWGDLVRLAKIEPE